MTEITENNDIISNETIGMNIKRLRQEHGWTQDELAKKIRTVFAERVKQ